MPFDPNWPIEFTDCTPAWLGGEQPSQLVIAPERPFGVPMAKFGTKGLYSLIAEPSDARLRNVELPVLRFDDGTAPVGGTFTSAEKVQFTTAGGEVHTYHWPQLRPVNHVTPKIEALNRHQIELEEQAQAEAATMEGNDFYGMF
ncbi:MAG: hypothetical protein KGR26_05995 [Cyanobacteria bacterium REEB65]|nr:hypothetical protein [Cyanobacteria bacterium REEB65]